MEFSFGLHYHVCRMAMENLEGRMEQMALQMQEQQALIASLKAKVDENGEVNDFSAEAVRKQKIQQVKSQYQNPADKRAMGFLTDLSMDAKELASKMGRILGATPGHTTGDFSLPTLEDQTRLVKAAVDVVGWLNTRPFHKEGCVIFFLAASGFPFG